MNSIWPRKRLGDMILVLTDYHANGSYKKLKKNVTLYTEPNYAVMIRTTNFEKSDFSLDLRFIDEHSYNFLYKSKVFPGDILMNKIANPGSVYLMPDLQRPVSLAMNLFLIRTNQQQLNQKFAYYFLKSNEEYVKSFTTGAAAATITKKAVRNLEITTPDLSIQHRITAVLSCYDDLIENNRQRIQLLEQTARLLYKEWFVHLRFPGHEHVKIKDGVPEGWARKAIGEFAPFHYGKSLKKDDRIPGPYPVYGSSGVLGTHEKALVNGPAIIVGRKGNVGSVYWSDSDFYPIDTVYFIGSEHSSVYLYYALLNTQFISTDVAVPGLNRDFAQSRKIIIPDHKILAQFEQDVGLLRAQINTLTKYNESLVQARDLLLPRLMNGEVAA